jgi:hypothetical protein
MKPRRPHGERVDFGRLKRDARYRAQIARRLIVGDLAEADELRLLMQTYGPPAESDATPLEFPSIAEDDVPRDQEPRA